MIKSDINAFKIEQSACRQINIPFLCRSANQDARWMKGQFCKNCILVRVACMRVSTSLLGDSPSLPGLKESNGTLAYWIVRAFARKPLQKRKEILTKKAHI